MSQLKLSGNASGTGIVTVAAPNTNSTYTVTLPAAAGTLARTDAAQTFTGVQTFSSDASVNGLTVGRGAGGVSTNTAVGASALNINTTGAYNTAVGSSSLYQNTTATANTAIGYNSLQGATTGGYNTAVGYAAAQSITGGTQNTACGAYALYNGSSTDNTAVGYSALGGSPGTRNVGVGYFAGNNINAGTYNVCIGYTSTSAAADNYEIVIGSSMSGITGKGSSTGFISPNGGGVYQGNNSSSWSTTSDQRLKKNIVDNTEGLDKISQIRVRNFEYRTVDEVTELPANSVIDKQGIQLGVIAQELQQVCPDCVKEESTGVLSVDSDNVFWHMVNAIKELNTRLQAAEAEIAALKGA